MGNGGDTWGTYWQCVELPQMRLYPKFGWPRVYAAGNGGAAYIPEGSPGLVRYNPGSGYLPVPGDLIIENPTASNAYGHVAVVDYVSGNTIRAVEQNGASSGRHDYSYNGSAYTGGFGSIKAVLHAPQNTFKNPGSLDSDLDGTPDSSDQCPNQPGPAAWQGCPDSDGDNLPDNLDACPDRSAPLADGCQRALPGGSQRIDINGDGRQDVLAFYRYDGGQLALFAWYAQAGGGLGSATQVWLTPSGWDGNRVIPAGIADVNADGRPDVLAYYRYDGGQLALFAWYAQAGGGLGSATQVWLTPSGWDGNRVLFAGTSGTKPYLLPKTPTITGTVKVGYRLTANPGTWGPTPVTLSYQWFRSGTAITGATGSSYLLTAADRTKTMTVRVTGSKAGYTTVARTSAATTAVATGTLTSTPVPTITGTKKVGYRLTANPGTWGPAPVTLSYQWFRSGTAITGATGSSYLLTAADRTKTMTVRVTGSKAGYTSVARTSAVTTTIT